MAFRYKTLINDEFRTLFYKRIPRVGEEISLPDNGLYIDLIVGIRHFPEKIRDKKPDVRVYTCRLRKPWQEGLNELGERWKCGFI